MATTEPAPDTHTPDVGDIASTITEHGVVQMGVRADAGSLAAAGIIARVCEAVGAGFHITTVRTTAEHAAWHETTDPDAGVLSIGIDAESPGGLPPVCLGAAVADRLDVLVPVALVVAGGLADGRPPSTLDAPGIDFDGIHQRPGLGIPTEDPIVGVAYSTLIHGSFSGDPDAVRELLPVDGDSDGESFTDTDRKGVASVVALECLGSEAATDRATVGLERFLQPHVGKSPFASLEGYMDVLDVVSRSQPGLGIALTTGANIQEAALAAWQDTATQVHAGIRDAELSRYDGVVVARTEGPVELVARVLRDYRSPEPVVLAINDGSAGLATVDREAGSLVEAVTDAVDASGLARNHTGFIQFPQDQTDAIVDAVQEAI